MRDLFFKTTQARHPSALLRFVYNFLRLRQQSVFFVRPRSKFSLFFRLQLLRKLFVWFYSDKFARRSAFHRIIKIRSSTFRTFLNFCTTLETYIPVILYRFHFVDNMRNAFLAIRTGFVFKNGLAVTRPDTCLRLGDFIELFFDADIKILAFNHLIKCLPTLLFRLTLRESIVNTAAFYSLFIKNYTFFSFTEKVVSSTLDVLNIVSASKYFNPMYLEQAFVSFFFSRVFLNLFRFDDHIRFRLFYNLLLNCETFDTASFPVFGNVYPKLHWRRVRPLWWYAPISLGITRAWTFLGMDSKEAERLIPPNKLFGSRLILDRDIDEIPDFLGNSLESRYVFEYGEAVLR